MDTFNIYDLLTVALGTNDQKMFQRYITEVMGAKYNKLNIPGFQFSPYMQADYTFEHLIKENSITSMAQYYDYNEPAVPFGGKEMFVSTGKIPRMKCVEYLNEDKIRKLKILEQRIGMKEHLNIAAKDTLFDIVNTLIGAHVNALSYQRHQMVGNRGLFLTDKENPKGLKVINISSNVPDKNVTTLTGEKRWFKKKDQDGIYSEEGTASNPIEDLKNMVRKVRGYAKGFHFEISEQYFEQISKHTVVMKALAAKLFPLSDLATSMNTVAVMSLDDKAKALSSILGREIVLIDHISSIERFDKESKTLVDTPVDSFPDNVFALVPDGQLGEFLTVEPIALNGANNTTFFDGRLMLTVDVDPIKKVQTFASEMTTLAVPNRIMSMYYLHPYSDK